MHNVSVIGIVLMCGIVAIFGWSAVDDIRARCGRPRTAPLLVRIIGALAGVFGGALIICMAIKVLFNL